MTIEKSWKEELQWVKEGRVYHARHGVLTTPAAFETDLVRQTPDLMVRVPKGTVIVPLRTQVVTEATNAAGLFQVLISSATNDPGTSNVTAFAPVNQNTRFATKGSMCRAYITATGNTGTAPANTTDLYRAYVENDIDAANEAAPFEQVLYDPFRGLGQLTVIGSQDSTTAFMVHVGNNTNSTGYILSSWAEFTYDEFYA